MNLGTLIEVLESLPADKVCRIGIGGPHSWRGRYYELAFDLRRDVTVGDMLKDARRCVGAEFPGWKGGTYEMDRDTDVFLANLGDCPGGWKAELEPVALAVMLEDLAVMDHPAFR